MAATIIVIAILIACAGIVAWARNPSRSSRRQRATALEHYRRDIEADQ